MKTHPTDDPKLTAYALGELNAKDRAEVARRLEDDPEARRQVEETLAFAVQLGSALRAEEAPDLRAAQLGAIREAARKKEKVIAFPAWLSRFAVPLAAAAGIAVAATLTLPMFRQAPTVSDGKLADAAGAPATRGEPTMAAPIAPTPARPEPANAFALQTGQSGRPAMSLAPSAGAFAASTAPQPSPSTHAPQSTGAREVLLLTKESSAEVERVVQNTEMPTDSKSGSAAGTLAMNQPAAPAPSEAFVARQSPAAPASPKQEMAPGPRPDRSGTSTHRGALTLGLENRSSGGGALNPQAAQSSKPQGGGAMPKNVTTATAPPGGGLGNSAAYGATRGGGALGRNLARTPEAQAGGAVAPSAPAAVVAGTYFAYTDSGAAKGKDREVVMQEVMPAPALLIAEPPHAPGQPAQPFDTATYDKIEDNPFQDARQNPLSTFSIDVDTGSYANVRRFLATGQLPPAGAVRIEEMLNYFEYDYPPAPEGKPFSVTVDVAEAPWNAKHRLARIGLKGREIDPMNRPPCNLVFLLDVSGSMNEPNKLPLVKQAMQVLLEQLGEKDRVAIVTYAGASGLALPSTPADRKRDIRGAIDALRPGGSTNGEAGIQLAYDIAKANFIAGGANRVILATDGDFNIGVTSRDELLRLIGEKAKSGVFLTVLGFGMDNLKDATLEQLADKGNGTYGYIDDEREAKRLFARHATGSLVTIAKDVKIQVEFNPAQVGAYRLIGYENRALRAEDFNDDRKDAGEIGAGHTVTALYELIPPGEDNALPKIDDLKYQSAPRPAAGGGGGELMTVKLRYKKPDGDTSDKIEVPVKDAGGAIGSAHADFKFAAAVAEFGMLLRNSPHKGTADWKSALELAAAGRGADAHGDRAEFIDLVRAAEKLSDQR